MRNPVLVVACATWWIAGMLSESTAFPSPDLLVNGTLDTSGAAEAPAAWTSVNNAAHAPDTQTWRSASTAWSFSDDGSIHQDVLFDIYPGEIIQVSGYLLTPGTDPLRDGSKSGTIELSFFQGDTPMSTHTATPPISADSPRDTWIYAVTEAIAPSNTTKARLTVRCAEGASGNGRFLVDDLSLTNRTHLPNLLRNSGLRHESGLAPVDWLPWDEAIGPESNQYLTAPNGWTVWDEGGIYQDITNGFLPGDTLMFGYWVLQPSSDPFDTQFPASQMRLVFYNAQEQQIENNWAMPYLVWTNAGTSWTFRTDIDTWIFSHNRSRVPSDAVRARIEIRQHSWEYGNGRFIADNAFLANLVHDSNVLVNPVLSGTGSAPVGWHEWNEGSHGPETNAFRSGGNAWAIWWDGGIFQDAGDGIDPNYPVNFGAYLLTPGWDALRNGTKNGIVELEFYAGDQLLSSHPASNTIHQGSAQDTWILCEGGAIIPEGATTTRLVIRCGDASSGDGRFFVDDVFLRSGGPRCRSFSGLASYGGSGTPPPHDRNSTNYTILDAQAHRPGDGGMLHLWGCNWKWIYAGSGYGQTYPVTSDTVLEFDFMSDGAQGEVNGIGLTGRVHADMSVFGPELFFQVYGTEAFSNQSWHNYPGSGWRHYEVPVGRYLMTNMYGIVIANQATNGQETSVYYRNIRLVENCRARAMIRDSDADECSDWHEWIAGTDELDAGSKLALHPEPVAAREFVLQWPSASNRTYTLYRCENLADGFVPVASDLAATPPDNAYTDTVEALERVYYRIQAKN
ncbi:MAG: hypothetical protein JXB04_06505 [Kiritimatiellae bacterium]|nr:hypothetical protein [Kiritimatiellia bacterium]